MKTIGLGYVQGSHKGPDGPAYCRGCGLPMRIGSRPDGYDSMTGEPRHVTTTRCSAPWWVRWLHPYTYHDSAEQDLYGNWPWQ